MAVSTMFQSLCVEDNEIITKRWMHHWNAMGELAGTYTGRLAEKFLGDYSGSGRDWKPEYQHGQARAIVTCKVRNLW